MSRIEVHPMLSLLHGFYRSLVRFLRLAGLAVWILVGVGVAGFVSLIKPWDRFRRRMRVRGSEFWLSGALFLIGVRVRVTGTPAPGAVLFACNHVSWLDILVLASVCRARFVSKAEVGHWPLLGWFAREGGTLFIRRGNGASFEAVVELMKSELVRGERLIFFPEGTTGNGQVLRRFRSRLFAAASSPGTSVQPVGLRYQGSPEVRERVPFLGEATILGNLWSILALPMIQAETCFFDPMQISSSLSPRQMAGSCESRIGQWLTGSGETVDDRSCPDLPSRVTDGWHARG